jgi:hypothetical protein
MSDVLSPGTLVRILANRDDTGKRLPDPDGLTGLFAVVVAPFPGQQPNNNDSLNIQIEDTRQRRYVSTDRLSVVRSKVLL